MKIARHTSTMRVTTCLLGCLVLLCLSSVVVSAAPVGYGNQVQHTITGSADGIQSSYVMRLVVWNTTGTNSGCNLYVGSSCRNDFNDLLITDGTDTVTFPRWINWAESGANYAVIYYNITVPVNTGSNTINIYYGNPTASNPDDPYGVFPFYDHLTALNTTLWTAEGSPSFSSSVMSMSGATQTGVISKQTFGPGWAVMSRAQLSLNSGDYCRIGWMSPLRVGIHTNWPSASGQYNLFTENPESSTVGTGFGSSYTGSMHVWRVDWLSSKVFASVDGTIVGTTLTTNIPSASDEVLYLDSYNTVSAAMSVDWVVAWHVTANPPSDGGWTGGSNVAPIVQTVKFNLIKIDPLGLFVGGVPLCSVKVYDNNNLLIINNVQTGSDGSISFQMYRSQYYTLIFTNLSVGVNKTWTGYPSDSEYTVYVWPWELEWTPGKAGPDSELKTITSFIEANLNASDQEDGDINVYYNDTTGQTTSVTINVYKRLNMTSDELLGTYTLSTTSANKFNKTFYIADVKGDDFKVVVTADNAYYGTVKRTFTWTFPGLRYSIPGLPAMAYVWISFIVPLLVALTVSTRNLRFGPIVFCAMSWGFNTLGWTSELGIGYPLVLAVATFFSILFIFNQKAREGGY